MICLPDCATCIHFHDEVKDKLECDAFAEIPPEIATGAKKHKEPVKGDRGIVWEQKRLKVEKNGTET